MCPLKLTFRPAHRDGAAREAQTGQTRGAVQANQVHETRNPPHVPRVQAGEWLWDGGTGGRECSVSASCFVSVCVSIFVSPPSCCFPFQSVSVSCRRFKQVSVWVEGWKGGSVQFPPHVLFGFCFVHSCSVSLSCFKQVSVGLAGWMDGWRGVTSV